MAWKIWSPVIIKFFASYLTFKNLQLFLLKKFDGFCIFFPSLLVYILFYFILNIMQ